MASIHYSNRNISENYNSYELTHMIITNRGILLQSPDNNLQYHHWSNVKNIKKGKIEFKGLSNSFKIKIVRHPNLESESQFKQRMRLFKNKFKPILNKKRGLYLGRIKKYILILLVSLFFITPLLYIFPILVAVISLLVFPFFFPHISKRFTGISSNLPIGVSLTLLIIALVLLVPVGLYFIKLMKILFLNKEKKSKQKVDPLVINSNEISIYSSAQNPPIFEKYNKKKSPLGFLCIIILGTFFIDIFLAWIPNLFIVVFFIGLVLLIIGNVGYSRWNFYSILKKQLKDLENQELDYPNFYICEECKIFIRPVFIGMQNPVNCPICGENMQERLLYPYSVEHFKEYS